MDLAGLCNICNRPSRTLNTCWRCGAKVCTEHFDSASGLCISCAPKGKKDMPKVM